MKSVTPKNRKHEASLSQTAAFLKEHWDGESPLLLGYSGGPDSKALLYSLIDAGVTRLHLAHVDHGWREESAREAETLREEANRLGCPFHSIRLRPPEQGNWEDAAREARLSFFQSLFSFPFQALLLAHQKEDRAETVLKRVLEGSHHLIGMEQVRTWRGMPIWRPLLNVRKREIEAYLSEKGLKAIIDPTNEDSSYLRARMRKEIFPRFGKDAVDNLALLGERAAEWRRYLENKTQVEVHRGPWGLFVELDGWERVERRHILQRIGREEGIVFPREALEALLDWLGASLPGRHLQVQGLDVYADRGLFFLLAKRKPVFEIPFEIGKGRSGDWVVEVEEGEAEAGWRQVWSGRFSVLLKKEIDLLDWPPPGRDLRKAWNERKVPFFLRSEVPVLLKDGVVEGEFLSGDGAGNGRKISFYFDPKDSLSGD